MASDPADMSTNTTPTSQQKASRVLACVLCQHRKIKCDRNTPCSNCIKANVTCTPSTPAPARKRRRPNQDLQERLARCEHLLKQYADGSVPSPTVNQAQLPLTNGSQSESVASTPTSVDTASRWKPAGKMIQDDGGLRFMDSYLWGSIHDELQAMREIVELDDPEDSSVLGSEDFSPESNIEILLQGESATSRNLEDYQPDPVHVFRLWQLFLDRINPLTKVIHVPSVQPYVMEATTNMCSIPVNYQALLFSVFTMAAVSLTETEALQLLGISRDDALRQYTSGAKIALTRFNFLKNYDMVALQSLLLYLISLQNRYDRHASWILSGMILRIAQKMGYHRDGESFNLTPFETEMRRRMWWQILMQDAKNALVSGLSHSVLPTNWDTKMPSNVNDADLFPGSNEPLQPREGPTEMAFCLMCHQITKFLVNADALDGFSGLEAAIMGEDQANGESLPIDLQKYRDIVDELEMNFSEIESRYIDSTAGNAHIAALIIRPMLTNKLREMMVSMKQQPEWGTEIFNAKDNLFKIVLMNTENSRDAYPTMEQTGFLWFVKLHFQLDLFAVLTGQLCQRPTGTLSDRGWVMVEHIYHYHTELMDMSQKAYVAQAQLVLKAWKAREQAYTQAGQVIERPSFIYRLRELSSESRNSDSQRQTPVAQPSTTAPQMTDMDQFLGGYIDVPSLNWDIWNTNTANNGSQQPQISAALFGGFGMGGMN